MTAFSISFLFAYNKDCATEDKLTEILQTIESYTYLSPLHIFHTFDSFCIDLFCASHFRTSISSKFKVHKTVIVITRVGFYQDWLSHMENNVFLPDAT